MADDVPAWAQDKPSGTQTPAWAQDPPVAAPDPVNKQIFQQSSAGKYLDAAQGNAFTRPLMAAGEAVSNAFEGPVGLSEESTQKLQSMGLLHDYTKGRGTLTEDINTSILQGAAAVADIALKTVNAAASGAVALGGGALNEVYKAVGMESTSPENVAKEAGAFTDYLFITAGMNAEGLPAVRTGEGTIAEAKQVLRAPSLAEAGEAVMNADREAAPVVRSPILKEPEKTPVIDEKSGNLNLDYISAQPDTKSMMATAAQAYADESGVTITNAQTIEDSQNFLDDAVAQAANGIPDSLTDYMRGDPVNRPFLYAARQLTVQTTKAALEAAQVAVKTGSPVDVEKALEADDLMMRMTGTRHEMSAEAGRVLQSHTIPMGESGADLEALANKLNASGLTPEERIKLMSSFDSPQSIAKFLEDTKKPTWADMGIFYVINNYLSGPITHAAYLASWGVQTVIRAGLETPVASVIGRVQKAAGAVLSPEDLKVLQTERQEIKSRLAEADSGGKPLRPSESIALEQRATEIDNRINKSTTVVPGEAKARFYGIGQGALDSIRAAGRALKTANIQMLPGELEAAKNAAREATEAVLQDGKSAEEAKAAGDLAYNRATIYSSNPILERVQSMQDGPMKAAAKAAGLVIGAPTRAIAGIHTLQKFSGYAESLNALVFRQAISEGLTDEAEIGARIAQLKNDTPPDMMRQAAEEAKYAALMGKPGVFGQKVEDLAHVNNWTRMVVPFSRVVTNLASQKYLERTPLGLLSPVIRENLLGINGNAKQANQIAKMLTGSTLLAGGAWLAAQGFNNGMGPENPKQRAFAYLIGRPPYSVRIGDANIAHRFFGVAGGSLSLGADLYDVMQQETTEQDAWAVIGNTVHVIGNDMLQENALKGAADLYDAIRSREPDSAKKYVLNAVAAAFTPYSVGMGQVARSLDPVMRSTAGADFWDRFKKTAESHMPIISENLIPRVDIFGRPMQHDGDYEAALKDPVIQAIERVGVYPAPVTTRFLNVKLDNQQYFDYATKAGGVFYHDMQKQVADPSWVKYDAATQADMIHQAIKDSRAAAKSYMCLQYPSLTTKCAKFTKALTQTDDE